MSLPNFNTADRYQDDSTVYFPPQSPTDPTTLIYFITGNPGVIGFNATYLQTLSELLNQEQRPSPNPNFSVLGTSLAGFETINPPRRPAAEGLFSLQSQIELSEDRLGTFLHRYAASLLHVSHPTKVILIGHSLGAYILLELLRRQQERVRNGDEGGAEAEFVGGICLFPAVIWLAKSPIGRKSGWILKLPGFARIAGALVRVLGFVIPDFIMIWLLGVLSGQPPKIARMTVAMLRSRMGVRQILWLAADGMRIIKEDKWDNALWACERTKLMFYFGESDHGVDDSLRDELISLRSVEGREWPKMVLDQQHIPHDFCRTRSDDTAKITAEWVEKMLER